MSARVCLTGQGLSYYPRKAAARAKAVGEVIGELPSGTLVVEWPWGMAFNSRAEVQEMR